MMLPDKGGHQPCADQSGKSLTFKKIVMGCLVAFGLAVGVMWLVDPDAFPIKGPISEAEQPGSTPAGADAGPPLSEAERIGRLQRSIDTDRKYFASLNAQFKDPGSEYNRAEKWFQKVDAEREETRQAIADLKSAGKLAEATARETSSKDLEQRWQQARDRFNLAIKEHKTLQESVDALTRKIQEDRLALDRLSGASAQAKNTPPPSDSASTAPPASGSASPTKPAPTTPSMPSLLPVPEMPFSLASSSTASAPSTPSTPTATPPADNVSREVERARQDARTKEDEAKKAENKAQSLTERLEELRTNISLTKKLLDTDRQESDRAQQAKNALDAELQTKMAAKAAEAELKEIVAARSSSPRNASPTRWRKCVRPRTTCTSCRRN